MTINTVAMIALLDFETHKVERDTDSRLASEAVRAGHIASSRAHLRPAETKDPYYAAVVNFETDLNSLLEVLPPLIPLPTRDPDKPMTYSRLSKPEPGKGDYTTGFYTMEGRKAVRLTVEWDGERGEVSYSLTKFSHRRMAQTLYYQESKLMLEEFVRELAAANELVLRLSRVGRPGSLNRF